MMTGGRNYRRLSIDSQKVSGSVCTPRRLFSRERGVKISPSHHLLICFPKTLCEAVWSFSSSGWV
ncbi:unnamed protein product [Brassica oleracea var. botrytis]|uniref:Uncharacterized protein n=1 Tax=Brassica oleracea var. oleracea TaxID=109376 RepID=A0A0D3D1S1_BRAOL